MRTLILLFCGLNDDGLLCPMYADLVEFEREGGKWYSVHFNRRFSVWADVKAAFDGAIVFDGQPVKGDWPWDLEKIRRFRILNRLDEYVATLQPVRIRIHVERDSYS